MRATHSVPGDIGRCPRDSAACEGYPIQCLRKRRRVLPRRLIRRNSYGGVEKANLRSALDLDDDRLNHYANSVYVMRLSEEDVTIEIVYDASEGEVVTARIAIPGGSIELMGEIAESGRTLLVTGVHVAVRGPAGLLTKATIETIARRVMKEMDYDEIVVEGAARTTGARPGHRPRRFRFR